MKSEPDDLEAVYRLAYKEFEESGKSGNRRRELSDKLASTIKDLREADFAGPAGFVSPAADAYRTNGKAEIAEWTGKFLEVSLREHSPQLLLPPWTDRLRSDIETSTEFRCLALERDVEKYLDLPRWHGYRPPPRPTDDYLQHQYKLLRGDLKAELNSRLETLQLRGTAELRKATMLTQGHPAPTPARPTIAEREPALRRLRQVSRIAVPAGTRWEDIEICLTSELRAQITVLGQPMEPRNFAEMGFVDRRNKTNKTPNQAWYMLNELARLNGILQTPPVLNTRKSSQSTNWRMVEKRIEEIRRGLRQLFGLPGDPLPFTKARALGGRHRGVATDAEGNGYRASFRIHRSESYDT